MAILRICALFCLLPLAARAANYLFLFHGASTTTTIYDADSLLILAQPQVGSGAVKAFGVPDPDPAKPLQFLKFYVVTTTSIVVLSPSFAVQTTLPLGGTLASGPNSAVLTPDGRRLLVAAGSQIHIVNTTDAANVIAAALFMPNNPAGIVVLPNSKRAYVMLSGSSLIQMIDLTTSPPQHLSTTVTIQGQPTAIGVAPNGSRIYVATPGALFDIDRVANLASGSIPIPVTPPGSIVFDPDPPVASAVLTQGTTGGIVNLVTRSSSATPFLIGTLTPIVKAAMPGGNRAMLLAAGRVYRGFLSLGGPPTEIASNFGATAVDMELTPDGRRLFVAYSDLKLVRLEPDGPFPPEQRTTPLANTGLSLAYMPAVAAASLEVYGGHAQSGSAATVLPSPLAVRARASNPHPAFGQTVTFSSTTTGVTFSDAVTTTNLFGVAETQVGIPVATPITVTAMIVSGSFSSTATFNLNGPSTGTEGLNKVSGDRQIVSSGVGLPFPLVVRAISGGVPVAFLPLTPTPTVPATLMTCPASVLTDAQGLASFTCTAGTVTEKMIAEVNVTDPALRTLAEPFKITILASSADLPTMLVLENSDTLVAAVRQTVADGIRVRATKTDSSTVADVGVVFASIPPGTTFSPETAVTDSSGRATTTVTFGCFVGSGSIRATALTPTPVGTTLTFRTTRGPVSQLIKRQGDNQRGNPGQRLDGAGQALVVAVGDACGNGIAEETVTWRVEPPGAANLENVFSRSDGEGRSSVLVRFGSRPGPFTITATLGTLVVTFNLAVNILPTRLGQVSGNNQNVPVGQIAALPLVVEVLDDNGVGAAEIPVSFAASGAAGALSAITATTDASGRASVRFTAGSGPGTATITASAITRTVTFTISIVGRVPVASALGFVDGAAFRFRWTPGGLGSIFGVGLMEGVSGVVLADRAPFPTLLRGLRVTIEGIDAPLISLANISGQEQINLQVPATLAPGTATVVIDNNGSRTTVAGVQIVAIAPAVFEFPSGGVLLAAALHADFSVVTQSNPARRGEVILLFITGMGRTTPPIMTNVAGPSSPLAETVVRPVVGINDQGAEVLGSFYAPTLYTAFQINFRVPDNAASGLAKLSVVAEGAASQDSRLPIQ